MTLRELHQQIGSLRKTTAQLALRLEIIDRIAEAWLHPQQETAKREAKAIRRELTRLYTRLHELEARIPTPETLSAAAFHRALALGMQIDAAEAERVKAYRAAFCDQALRMAA